MDGGRRHGWLPIAGALVLLVSAALCPGRAAAAGRSLPPQGLYESCDVQYQLDACEQRLRAASDAGFRVVLNYQQFLADRDHILAYAAAAQAAGIKLVWPLKDAPWWSGSGLRSAYPALARDCACTSDGQFLAWVVDLVRWLPATWGYYVGDETPPTYAARVRQLAARVRALDPVHPRLFVGDGEDIGSVSPFSAAADVLGGFVYPVGTPRPLSTVASVSDGMTRLARGRKRPAVVLQAFSWGQYPDPGARFHAVWPTRRQLRTERDLALAAGRPRLLLWYSLFDIARSDDPERHWGDLVWAALGSSRAPQLTPPA